MNNSSDNNFGDWNSGYWNSGYCNSGNRNSGDWNSGHWNSGDCNSGNWNSGNWNSGDWNSGYCNSITPDQVLVFNKHTQRSEWNNAVKPRWMYVKLTEWIYESDMSDKDKEAYPSYTTTGGYLKVYSSLKEAYVEAWEKASTEDRELTFKLPNYDDDVFREVFGFTPVIEKKHIIEIDGKKVEISKESFKSLKEQLNK